MMISVADVSKIIPIGFIVIALGWRYISVPLHLRKALWSAANPFVRMADQRLPPDVERELGVKSQTLISLGFNPIDATVCRKPYGRIESVYIFVFENRKTADIATLYALSAGKDSGNLTTSLFCIFVRAFSNKTSIVTGNRCTESFPRRTNGANCLSLRAPSNLSMLYTVHASRTFRHQRDHAVIIIPESKLIDELQTAYVEDCEYSVARLSKTNSTAAGISAFTQRRVYLGMA